MTTDAKAILKERARSLARPLGEGARDDGGLSVVEFRLTDERYAIEQVHVREVCRLTELTPLPGTP